MTWVRRSAKEASTHTCSPPMHEVSYSYPSASLTPPPVDPPPLVSTGPDGEPGDLWRCDECGKLWRVGRLSWDWWPATRWQRLRYRRRGHEEG